MRDKVGVGVLLAATGRVYEFRLPYDLRVSQAAQLVAHILALREAPRYAESAHARLMLLDGEDAGSLLDGGTLVRDFVADEVLVDGSMVALV